MATNDETSDTPPPPPKRSLGRRLVRWTIRLSVWGLVAILLGTLVIGVVGWIAFQKRTWVVNVALARFVEPYEIRVGPITFPSEGKVVVSDIGIALDGEADSEEVFTIREVDLTYNVGELRRDQKFRRVVLQEPVLRMGKDDLETLMQPSNVPVSPETTVSEQLAPFARLLALLGEGLRVEDGRVELEGTDGVPPLEFDWEVESEGLVFETSEETIWANDVPVSLRIDHLKIGEGTAVTIADEVVVQVKVRRDLQGVEVDKLSVKGMDARINPNGLKRFQRQQPQRDQLAKAAEAAVKEETGIETVERPDFVTFRSIQLPEARFAITEFVTVETGFPVLPDVGVTLSLDWEDVSWNAAGFSSRESLSFAVKNVSLEGGLESSNEPSLFTAESVEGRFSPQALIADRSLDQLTVSAPKLWLSEGSVARFLASEKTPGETAGPAVETEPFGVKSLVVQDGKIESSLQEIDASFEFDVAIQDLAVGGDALVSSVAEQVVEIRDLQLAKRGGELRAEVVSVTAVPDEVLVPSGAPRVRELRVVGPELSLKGDLPFPLPDPEAPAGETVASSPTIPIFDRLSISEGRFDLATESFGPQIPEMSGAFAVSQVDASLRATLSRLRIRPPGAGEANPIAEGRQTIAENDVGFIREIEIDFTPESLLEKHVDAIRVSGATLKVGDGLKQLAVPVEGGAREEGVEEADATEPNAASSALFPEEAGAQAEKRAPVPITESADPSPPISPLLPENAENPASSWTIGDLVITESSVQFESLIPEIEGLSFAIETALTDVPLSKTGLLGGSDTQKIELAGIEVKDPFDGFIPVAFLPTIFVEFTWAGLAEQRIERIDLIGPSLYIGEGLFRWVRYQRDFRAQNEGAGVSIEGAGDAEGETPQWEVGQIQAHSGKMVIAPKGYPIGVVPFPFEASTNMNEGNIALELKIPEEDFVYSFPDYKIDLFGLRGGVQFNVPIRQEDNNLNQLFEIERVVYKQYEAEELYLSVTYDEEGIYGKFGGKAYDGYAEGGFNYYLKRDGFWDAWLAGTSMNTGPITEIVAPDAFLMQGKVTAKLVSEGRGLLFGETTGEFEVLEPGRIDIKKADQFIDELPDEWTQLKKSLTKVSLETFKAFDYTTGEGSLYFRNRDGWLKFGLAGDSGSRNVKLFLHDWREEKPVTEKPPPEVIAEALLVSPNE